MTSYLNTEDGKRIVQEDVSGITGASSLNDTKVSIIYLEDFTTNPLANGWLVGDDWVWNSVNGNMEMA